MTDTVTGTPETPEADQSSGTSLQEYLFLVLRCDEPGFHHTRISLDRVHEIAIGRPNSDTPAIRGPDSNGRIELDIADPWCSKRHLLLQRLSGGWIATDLHSKNGSLIGGSRFEKARLHDRDVIEVGHTLLLYRSVSARVDYTTHLPVKTLPTPPQGADLFRTLSPVLEQQLHLLRRAAPSSLPVLIHGESGTGKELAARAIHQLSGRTGPFVAINCGALHAGLLESELFGHVRGAFSGATEHRSGLVRAAHQGTLFLDELAEAPHDTQVRMLRVLQEQEVLAVGATTPVPVDIRVVAATHGDVHAMAKHGSFRPDFLARLTGFELRLPPLRQRPEDIGHLAASFLRAALGDRFDRVTFDPDVGRALLQYPWPLNVRELERTTAAAAALIDDRVTLSAFTDRLVPSLTGPEPSAPSTPPPSALPESPHEPARGSRDHVAALLRAHRGNISGVARELSTSRSHVHRLLARYGLSSRGNDEE
jgi:DNA-binding NtrC family response regulator